MLLCRKYRLIYLVAITCIACDGAPGRNQEAEASPTPTDSTPIPDDPEWPADEELPPEFDFPPYLSLLSNQKISVSWRSTEQQTGTVTFGRYGHPVEASAKTGAAAKVQHVEIDLLTPGQAYSYTVELHPSGAKRTGVFRMPGSRVWRFAHFGEFHAPTMAPNVAAFANIIREFRPHVIIDSGDMVDDGDVFNHWRSYMQTSRPWISNTFLLPTGSNHVNGTGGNAYLKSFFVLPNNERWYTTRFSQVEFFVLDSTLAFANPELVLQQPAWIKTQNGALHDGQDDPDFVIGSWHFPACSSSYKDRATDRALVQTVLVDAFQQSGGINMILVGHDKYYERSLLSDSIVHVQTNTGNLNPGEEGDNDPRCKPVATRRDTHSLTLVDVRGDQMNAKAVAPDGEELDVYSITK